MEQLSLFPSSNAPPSNSELLTVPEAATWAAKRTGRNVTVSNINYLIQYGHIRKLNENGNVRVAVEDLENYYNSNDGARELNYKARLGNDINWTLSFANVKEAESTKHVHRLHPYKGKFIPQLVEYFIDGHTDNFKREVYFHPGDIILDPFAGSGTTMVQASECGINAIGIDISAFNALIANSKVALYDLLDLQSEIQRISAALHEFSSQSQISDFENRLHDELNRFNKEHFPVPDYNYRLRRGEIDEKKYGAEMEKRFLPIYQNLTWEYRVNLRQERNTTFLEKWFSRQIREEIDFIFARIKEVGNLRTKKILTIILSRTMRSCRATTHSDLATLKEPVTSFYYCSKHRKICKPLYTLTKWWERYCTDTVDRLAAFSGLRTATAQYCLTGDSRNIDILDELAKRSKDFASQVSAKRIAGVFSSPPYVGMINYHEQHAYAYDLFGFERHDESEIGALFKGNGKEAQRTYVKGISDVLINCKRFFADSYHVFLVANDKFNLYPDIAEKAGMRIVNTFRRPVLNRSEKDKAAYSETIFHIRDGNDK